MPLDPITIASASLWLFVVGFIALAIIRVGQATRRTARGRYAIDHYWAAIFSVLAAACFATLRAFLRELIGSIARFEPTAIAMLAITALASSAAVLVATIDLNEVERSLKKIIPPAKNRTHQKQA